MGKAGVKPSCSKKTALARVNQMPKGDQDKIKSDRWAADRPSRNALGAWSRG
jgi:hypothetical protein